MFKNVASTFIVFAFDATTNVPKTGDAANITAYVSKDYGTVTVLGDLSATEFDATNAPGYYWFTAAQAETNADCLMVTAKSSTANIKVLGAPAVIYTRPTTGWLAPATAGRTLVVDAAGLADANVVKIGPTGSGTAQTARDIGTSVLLSSGTGTGQLDFTSGIVKANVTQLLGTAWLTPGTAGTPDVNVKLWNALTTVALPVVPTVAGRTLDISAGGEAGVDWANVGSPTTAVNLSGTTVNLTNTVTTYTGNTPQTGDNFARIGAAGVGLTAVGLTGTQTFNNTGTWTGNIVGTLSTLTTYTGNTPQTGDSYARIGAAGASLTSVGLGSAYDFAKGTVAVTESYNADGSAPTPVQALMLILQMLTESSVATTTLTVKKLDGSTSAATFTLNSATAPTSITRTT